MARKEVFPEQWRGEKKKKGEWPRKRTRGREKASGAKSVRRAEITDGRPHVSNGERGAKASSDG